MAKKLFPDPATQGTHGTVKAHIRHTRTGKLSQVKEFRRTAKRTKMGESGRELKVWSENHEPSYRHETAMHENIAKKMLNQPHNFDPAKAHKGFMLIAKAHDVRYRAENKIPKGKMLASKEEHHEIAHQMLDDWSEDFHGGRYDHLKTKKTHKAEKQPGYRHTPGNPGTTTGSAPALVAHGGFMGARKTGKLS